MELRVIKGRRQLPSEPVSIKRALRLVNIEYYTGYRIKTPLRKRMSMLFNAVQGQVTRSHFVVGLLHYNDAVHAMREKTAFFPDGHRLKAHNCLTAAKDEWIHGVRSCHKGTAYKGRCYEMLARLVEQGLFDGRKTTLMKDMCFDPDDSTRLLGGRVVDQQYVFRLRSLAARCGDVEAMVGLAQMYRLGIGTEVNLDKASTCVNEATAKKGKLYPNQVPFLGQLRLQIREDMSREVVVRAYAVIPDAARPRCG